MLTGRGAVADTSNADVLDVANGARASHASRNLDLDRKVGGAGSREAKSNTGNVLCDLSLLECSRVGATRSWVDISSQGASAVLVDLVVGHRDGAIVRAGRKTRSGAGTGSFGDTCLRGAISSLFALALNSTAGTAIATTPKEAVEQTTLASCSTTGGTSAVHECIDGRSSIDRSTTRSATESTSPAAAELTVTDDRSVFLSTAEGAAAITGSAIND